MRSARLGTSSSGSDAAARLDRELAALPIDGAAWILMYAAVDAPVRRMMAALKQRAPNVPVFGATSFQGVFTPTGFGRGAALLIVEREDQLRAAVSLQETGPQQAEERARRACAEIERQLGKRPDVLLLHATPGFEERILDGIRAAFGTDVAVYGGSAADDDITGKWQVFANGSSLSQGFMLAGLEAKTAVRGGFLGGYLPTEHTGTVTRAAGRSVLEIDGKPAAAVYNDWTRGAIDDELLHGGSVLLKTNLLPVARLVGESHAMPRRLLSHPHQVDAKTQALSFFSEFEMGDRITLMTSTKDPLITRVRRTVQRARGAGAAGARGGLLVYCGGCLGVLLDRASQISQEFRAEVGDVPFVGIATFGEQGCFFDKTRSLHGNLMCTVLLF